MHRSKYFRHTGVRSRIRGELSNFGPNELRRVGRNNPLNTSEQNNPQQENGNAIRKQ